jgi:hypothetical protein
MTSLQLSSPGLTLAAAEVDEPPTRVATGLLVPFGEPGRTNLGAGVQVLAARLPGDGRVIGINGHDRERPVSRLLSAEIREDGIHGRIRIAETPAGDVLIAEIREGIRDGLSVEMSDLTFDKDGNITDGLVEWFAHVPRGAFDSARVHQLAAALHDPNTPGEKSVTELAPAPAETTAPPAAFDYDAMAAAMLRAQATTPPAAPELQAATAPAGMSFAAVPGVRQAEGDPIAKMAELQAEVFRQQGMTRELRAALADITYTSVDLFKQPAGSIGEKLWEGAGYTRQFVQLCATKPLTSYKYKTWQWVNRPKVAAYAGDKAEIPTNTVSVEQFEKTATRVAGGWDIDRALVDFPNPEFWAEFWAAGVESYQEVTDLQAAAAIVAAARDITVDGNVPASYTALNVAQPNTAEGILKAVALGRLIMQDTPRVRKGPDYVLVSPTEYMKLIDLTNLDLPAFLALLGVEPGNFKHSTEVPAGSIIMGVKPAVTFRELGGASPIRVEALDVANGGLDKALFGYTGISHDRPGGVIEVPLAA